MKPFYVWLKWLNNILSLSIYVCISMYMYFAVSSSYIDVRRIEEKLKKKEEEPMLNVTFSIAYWKLVEHSNVDKCVGAFLFCICRWCITSSCGLVVYLFLLRLLFFSYRKFVRFWDCDHVTQHACLEPSTHWLRNRETIQQLSKRKIANAILFTLFICCCCDVVDESCGKIIKL